MAVLAAALLGLSFGDWWRDDGAVPTTADAWSTSTTWTVTISVIVGSAAVWLLRSDRRARALAAGGAAMAAAWFLVYTWLDSGLPASSGTAGRTEYATTVPAPPVFAGFSYGPYLGSLVIVALVALMAVPVAVDLVRHRPRPREWQWLIPVMSSLPVVAAVALLAVSMAPWWHDDSQTANAWFSSTVWVVAIGGAVIALAVWWRARSPRARVVAAALATGAALTAVGFTWHLAATAKLRHEVYYVQLTLGTGVDFHPVVPRLIHRDHLVASRGVAGVDVGAYLGVGLMVLIAAVLLVLVVRELRSGRRDRRTGASR